MTPVTMSFEEACDRLEQILEEMISGRAGLEKSIDLFEEAEGLVRACHVRLEAGGQKIEALIKQRNNLVLDSNQRPRFEPFAKSQPSNFLLHDEPATQ